MDNDITLVLGATGKTGRRVAARLRLRDLPVRAASRSSATRFDWSSPAGWDAALDGVTAVYVVPPPVPGPVHEFVARAERAGARRLVLLSGHGADRWGDSGFGPDMRSAEDAVRGSALDWTVVRAANFFQNFADIYRDALVAGQLALPVGAAPEPFVDVEDVAEAAATVLAEPGRHAEQVYELTGPRALTFAQATELIAKAAGRPVGYRQISAAEHIAALVEQGWSEDDAGHDAAMFSLITDGVIAETTDDVATLLGRPPRGFEDFVVRTAASGTWAG